MGEGQLHARVDLLHGDLLPEVRADTPVALAEDPVVDEAAPGPLEDGVVDEEHEPAADGQHPHRLGQKGVRVERCAR